MPVFPNGWKGSGTIRGFKTIIGIIVISALLRICDVLSVPPYVTFRFYTGVGWIYLASLNARLYMWKPATRLCADKL